MSLKNTLLLSVKKTQKNHKSTKQQNNKQTKPKKPQPNKTITTKPQEYICFLICVGFKENFSVNNVKEALTDS